MSCRVSKNQFIEALIKELNEENERRVIDYGKSPLDVCFMVSVVDQNIVKCNEFMSDIEKYGFSLNGYEEDHTDGYTNGKIRIMIKKPEVENRTFLWAGRFFDYWYEIEFLEDKRMGCYCECSEDDDGFNKEHNCCGNGCDWYAPSFSLTKVINQGRHSWDCYAKEYWMYKDKFEKDEENKNKKNQEFKINQEREYIEQQIQELKTKLDELNNRGDD